MAPEEHDFTEPECPMLDHDVYLGVGAHKSARCIEGPTGRSGAAMGLLVESTLVHRFFRYILLHSAKKTPFYSVEPVMTAAQRIVEDLESSCTEDIEKLTDHFRGKLFNALVPTGSFRHLRHYDSPEDDPQGVGGDRRDGADANVSVPRQ